MFSQSEIIFFVQHFLAFLYYLCSMRNEVNEWIENPKRDYHEGVRLLERHSSNSRLVHVFANRSPRFAMNDLVAELRRLHVPDTDIPSPSVVPAVAPKPTVPPVVDTAKKMVHDAWVKLSKIHRQMYDTGEGNGEKEVAERKRLMNEREPLIERYNSIYEAKEGYFAGVLTLNQLQEVVDGKSLEQVLHPEPAKVDIELNNLSDLKLAMKAKAAKAAITRCKNQLLYQQDTAAKEENPMPQCPRRKEIEERLKERETELAKLEEELMKRN